MEHLLGEFFVYARWWARLSALYVFDDALVEVRAPRIFSAFLLLGPPGSFVGPWLKGVFVVRSLRKKRAAMDALGPAMTSTEAAAKIRGAKRITLSEVESAELKNLRQRAQTLVLRTSHGKTLKWVVKNDDGAAQFANLLAPLLGGRLMGTSATPDASSPQALG